MKTKKPRITPSTLEYRLLVLPSDDDPKFENAIFVGLRTLKEFSNFKYELVVTDTLIGDTLTLNIIGLRTPRTDVPTTGVASFTNLYSNGRKIKTIIIRKMEKKENSFSVRITERQTVVKSIPDRPFVELVTKREEW